jgi:hypothetical protein
LSSFAKSLLYDALGQREWLGWVTEEFPNLDNRIRRPITTHGANRQHLEKIERIVQSEGIVCFHFSQSCNAMLIYLSFTLIWTLVVVCHAATSNRILRRMIQPFERQLAVYGVPDIIYTTIAGLLRLSIIPLGFLWAAGLMVHVMLF